MSGIGWIRASCDFSVVLPLFARRIGDAGGGFIVEEPANDAKECRTGAGLPSPLMLESQTFLRRMMTVQV